MKDCAHHACGVVLQIDGESRLDSATSWHHRFGLQHPLHHTQGVMQRALHLITHEIIRPAQDERGTRACLCAEIQRGKLVFSGLKFGILKLQYLFYSYSTFDLFFCRGFICINIYYFVYF